MVSYLLRQEWDCKKLHARGTGTERSNSFQGLIISQSGDGHTIKKRCAFKLQDLKSIRSIGSSANLSRWSKRINDKNRSTDDVERFLISCPTVICFEHRTLEKVTSVLLFRMRILLPKIVRQRWRYLAQHMIINHFVQGPKHCKKKRPHAIRTRALLQTISSATFTWPYWPYVAPRGYRLPTRSCY